MKLSLRRAADAPEAVDDAPPPPPTPPRGRPQVAYALVDGRTLWLAVPAGPGTLGLRDEAGTMLPLSSAVADEQPGYLSARVDLDDLLEAGSPTASYDAVLVGGAGNAKPLWSAPLPGGAQVRPRVSPDGTHLWDLARGDDGTLRVVRVPQPPAAWLRAIALAGDTVTMTIDPIDPPAPDQELRLVDQEGTLVLTRPLTAGDDGLLSATLSVADLPTGDESWPRVHVGDVPVRRPDDDLVRAEHATMLPLLFGDDPETPAARFRFTPEGILAVRIAGRVPGRPSDRAADA